MLFTISFSILHKYRNSGLLYDIRAPVMENRHNCDYNLPLTPRFDVPLPYHMLDSIRLSPTLVRPARLMLLLSVVTVVVVGIVGNRQDGRLNRQVVDRAFRRTI